MGWGAAKREVKARAAPSYRWLTMMMAIECNKNLAGGLRGVFLAICHVLRAAKIWTRCFE